MNKIILGYIVSDRKPTNIKGFIECVNDFSKTDSIKPILVVGVNRAKEILKDKFNYFDKKISDNVFWTYKKTERHTEYDEDLDKFYKLCLDIIINNIKYNYINIYNIKYSRFKILYNILLKNNKNYIYINKGMIYILYNKTNVLGISLVMAKYCGINPKKIIDKLKSNKNNLLFNDFSEEVREIKQIFQINNYLIPYFLQDN